MEAGDTKYGVDDFYFKAQFKLSMKQQFIRQSKQQFWEIMALVAGFAVSLIILSYFLLTWGLSMHKNIALAGSIFYISEVKEETHKKQAVNVRLRSEFGTRYRLRVP